MNGFATARYLLETHVAAAASHSLKPPGNLLHRLIRLPVTPLNVANEEALLSELSNVNAKTITPGPYTSDIHQQM